MKKTLYDVLGIDAQATAPEVTENYRALSAKLAAGTDAASINEQKLLNYALETLTDPRRRADYDLSLSQEPEEFTAEPAPDRPRTRPVWSILIALALAAVFGLYHYTHRSAPTAPEARPAPPPAQASAAAAQPAPTPSEPSAPPGTAPPEPVPRIAPVRIVTPEMAALAARLAGHWSCSGKGAPPGQGQAVYDFLDGGTYTYSHLLRAGKSETAVHQSGRYRVPSDSLLILANAQGDPPEEPVRIMEFNGNRLVLEHSYAERVVHTCSR
jgi:hypothetical protein